MRRSMRINVRKEWAECAYRRDYRNGSREMPENYQYKKKRSDTFDNVFHIIYFGNKCFLFIFVWQQMFPTFVAMFPTCFQKFKSWQHAQTLDFTGLNSICFQCFQLFYKIVIRACIIVFILSYNYIFLDNLVLWKLILRVYIYI